MASRLRVERRRRSVARVASTCGLITVLFLSIGLAARWIPAGAIEKLSCEQTSELFAQYHAGQLSADEHRQVENHLNNCPHCRKQYRLLYPSEAHRSPPASLAYRGL